MDSTPSNNTDRRQFIKTAGAFALTGASLSAKTETEPSSEIPSFIEVDATNINEYHVCKGLNMQQQGIYSPGTAPSPNLPQKDLHSCMGGNSCAGLGACGTGEYARQYWITDNTCGKTKNQTTWDGNGGCGVPIGTGNTGYITTQLNSAAPTDPSYPKEFLGQPVWNIARSRFEAKMVKMNLSFDAPPHLKNYPDLHATSWTKGTKYKRPAQMPTPYPKPWPNRASPNNVPSE